MSFINNRGNKKSNCVPSLQNHPYLDRSTLLQFIYNDRRTDQINRLSLTSLRLSRGLENSMMIISLIMGFKT